MISLPLGLAMSGEPEGLVNLRSWSRPCICRLRHRDDVAEQLAEAALDRTLQIVLLAATERHRVSGGGITGADSLDCCTGGTETT